MRLLYTILRFTVVLFIVSTVSSHAQRSVAELIATIPPPKFDGRVQATDGARQVNYWNHYLVVTNFWAGLQIVDISNIESPKQVGFVPLDDEAYYTYMNDQYAYVANHAAGIQIFDLRNPENPARVAHIKTPGNAYWVQAELPYLYVAMGNEGFCIMNISDMNAPLTTSLEIPGGWVWQVQKVGNLLYVAAKRQGLLIYDISNLEQPRKLSQHRTGYHTTMIQVEDSLAYLADGPGGLLIMNVSKPDFPVEISRLNVGGFVGNLHKAGNHIYLANRAIGLQIVNVMDPGNPILESTYLTDSQSYGVIKRDIYVFLAANFATLVMRHNNAPLLADISDLSLNEGTAFNLQLQATEPDGDAVQFAATNLPEGSTFDNEKGLFSWLPTYDQSGVYPNIIFRVIEATESKLSDADTITITVHHVNRWPDLPALRDTTIEENGLLTLNIPPGSDPDKEDQNRLSYRVESLPDGATFDPETRTFNWKPTFEQSGIYVVDFLIDDGAGGIDREPVTITVKHVDRPPAIDPLTDQIVDEAQTISLVLSGKEPDREDQDKISFSMENLPAGAQFDAETHTFVWTPGYEQSGNYPDITATMKAGLLSDTTRFSITVNHVNRPPVLKDISDKVIDENQTLSFKITGSDPDREDTGQLSFSAENLPEGATFDRDSLKFRWQPTFEQAGVYEEVAFVVQDAAGLTDRKAITITVNHVNRPPSLAGIHDVVMKENTPLEVQLEASDPDREDAGKLVFSSDQLPEGASLHPQTGLFKWTPTFEQSGIYTIRFMVSDGQLSDSATMQISVEHVNRPPHLAPLADQVVDENQPLFFTVIASDPDEEDAGKLVVYTKNIPEGAIFDTTTLEFRWLPTFEQSGTYPVTFDVKDPSGLSEERSLTITVNPVNRPPNLEAITPQTVKEGQTISFQLRASDPDREDEGKLVFESSDLPAGATLHPSQGKFSWAPGYDQAGDYELTFLVRDAGGLTSSQTVPITVENVNRAPKLTAPGNQTIKEGETLRLILKAEDPDKEDSGNLIFEAHNLPTGADFNGDTGAFLWTPAYDQQGEYRIEFTVRDPGGLLDQATISISVQDVPKPEESQQQPPR